jgi:hypothetical protein
MDFKGTAEIQVFQNINRIKKDNLIIQKERNNSKGKK